MKSWLFVFFQEHLEIKMTEEMKSARQSPSYSTWRMLASATLARILLFNKRRAEEAARLLVSKFNARPNWETANSELIRSLPALEKELMQK